MVLTDFHEYLLDSNKKFESKMNIVSMIYFLVVKTSHYKFMTK